MKRKTIYAIAVLIFSLMMLGTAGALEMGALTFSDACWQILVSMIGALWFWNLIRIEELRSARRRR